MQNPIMQAIAQRSPSNYINPQMQNAFGQMKQMFAFIKNSGNPAAMVQQMAMQNPRFNAAMQQAQQYVNSCGGNPQQAMNMFAQQLGIDVNQFFN